MNLPSWIPEPIRPVLLQMNADPACAGRRRTVFDRLLQNPRMQPVYSVLLQLDRETGNYRYAARARKSDQSAEEAQAAAIREVLQLTISAASDCISVSKIEQIEEAKQRWDEDATRLRVLAHDMDLAAELGMLGLDERASRTLALQDSQGLRRVANWLDGLKSEMRGPDDPLIVERHRGDPVVRGVQIMIGVKLDEQFGERLDGTGATLASVALGAETSPRASRSALAERKPRKRRSAS
jgi:hypothetical protein